MNTLSFPWHRNASRDDHSYLLNDIWRHLWEISKTESLLCSWRYRRNQMLPIHFNCSTMKTKLHDISIKVNVFFLLHTCSPFKVLCAAIWPFINSLTGGSFPFTIGRIEHGHTVRPDLCAVDNRISPRKYLGSFYTDSLVHDPIALKLLIDVIGKVSVCINHILIVFRKL